MMRTYFTDCLQKIWQNDCEFPAVTQISCFENEVAGVQLAVINDGGARDDCRFETVGDIPLRIDRVGYVGGDYTDSPDADDYVIAKHLHVFPDPLLPVDRNAFALKGTSTNVFWFTIGTGTRLPPREYALSVGIYDQKNECLGRAELTVEVKRGVLPACDIPVTDWMHYDAICNYYRVAPFGKKFRRLTENFLRTAVAHGINTVYVPLFTPPLDTKVGGERTTVQLVDVTEEDGAYSFDFSRLRQFLAMAERCGVTYFEFSHLFTQWGAQACPKIVANVKGRKKRIFGWDTPADCAEYTAFLEAFLPRFGAFLRDGGYCGRSFVHISDEPSEYWIGDYAVRRALVKRLLPDVTHIDALSEIEFLRRGLVDIPVAATETAHTFAESGKPFWVYYCLTQCMDNLSNRFMNMPSERTRVIGMQLYESGARGFLHWAYNFYNTALSVRQVDPFFETDAGGFFPSGDSFIVYPGKDGAYSSVRLEVFRAAIQDYRALKLLESLIGRARTRGLLKEYGIEGFKRYPHGSAAFLAVRRAIDAAIGENMRTEN